MTEKSAVNFECCNRFVRHEPPSRGHMGHGNPSPHRICHPVAGNSDRPATLGGWPTETVVREKYTFTCEIHDERGDFAKDHFLVTGFGNRSTDKSAQRQNSQNFNKAKYPPLCDGGYRFRFLHTSFRFLHIAPLRSGCPSSTAVVFPPPPPACH